jgi:hypothetical protein
VVTNHHCAYGAIQLNSTAAEEPDQDGFNAPTTADELSAGPNARVYVLDAITDVTAPAKAAMAAAGNDPLKRSDALEDFRKQQIAACEAEPGYRCRLQLCRRQHLPPVQEHGDQGRAAGLRAAGQRRQVRRRRRQLDVAAHTGDFSFYRAYVGKDSKRRIQGRQRALPAAALPEVADQPLGAGDFVMVAGYPGRTNRYALAGEFENTANWTYPTVAKAYKDVIAWSRPPARPTPDVR